MKTATKKASLTKPFNFTLPINKGAKKVGQIEVVGKATLYFKGDPDIKYTGILWGGMNVLPLFENLDAAEDVMQYITGATLNHIKNHFTEDTLALRDDESIVDATRAEGNSVLA